MQAVEKKQADSFFLRKTLSGIVATLSHKTLENSDIRSLVAAGASLFRFNCSHGSLESRCRLFELIKKQLSEEDRCPLFFDTQGPEVRVGALASEQGIDIPAGGTVIFRKGIAEGDSCGIGLLPERIFSHLELGTLVRINDGLLEGRVIERLVDGVVVCFPEGGLLRPSKGVVFPELLLDWDLLSPADYEELPVGFKLGIQAVALSFVRTANDIHFFRKFLKQHHREDVWIIAKIENRSAVENLEAIAAAADFLMVARGDLGVNCSLEMLPALQRQIIATGIRLGRPVITATQMLESMVHHPRPTRAEVSDVALATAQGSCALMLSAETAVGKFPEKTIEIMHTIAFAGERGMTVEDKAEKLRQGPIPVGELERRFFAALLFAVEVGAAALLLMGDAEPIRGFLGRWMLPVPLIFAVNSHTERLRWSLFRGVLPIRYSNLSDEKSFISLVRDGLGSAGEKIVFLRMREGHLEIFLT